MQESTAVADAWRRLCDAFSKGAVDEFDDLVSREVTPIIGTAPGELVTRRALRFAFESKGLTLQSRSAYGYAEGSLGWVVDAPQVGFPVGSMVDCRLTAIVRQEGEVWRLVHAHFSSGVPDEEIVQLQHRWSADEPPD